MPRRISTERGRRRIGRMARVMVQVAGEPQCQAAAQVAVNQRRYVALGRMPLKVVEHPARLVRDHDDAIVGAHRRVGDARKVGELATVNVERERLVEAKYPPAARQTQRKVRVALREEPAGERRREEAGTKRECIAS
jgi:hypothetical protein